MTARADNQGIYVTSQGEMTPAECERIKRGQGQWVLEVMQMEGRAGLVIMTTDRQLADLADRAITAALMAEGIIHPIGQQQPLF